METLRELDMRRASGLKVTLFWDSRTDRLTTSLQDANTSDGFKLERVDAATGASGSFALIADRVAYVLLPHPTHRESLHGDAQTLVGRWHPRLAALERTPAT
jgi:hypothetical protein